MILNHKAAIEMLIERSCQRYLAITQTMVEPDPLKIQYREALIHAVQAVVKGQLRPQPGVIARMARDVVNEADRDAFVQMLTDALRQLHEGSVAQYRLGRSEYLAWQQDNDLKVTGHKAK